MEKPHTPTMAELEDLFREMDNDLPNYDDRIRLAARTLIYAWDEDLSIRNLAPFVEELRRALDGRP